MPDEMVTDIGTQAIDGVEMRANQDPPTTEEVEKEVNEIA